VSSRPRRSRKRREIAAAISKPPISVVIDTYNHERFIDRAIRSVLEQDWPGLCDVQILVVDDGSTDGTAEIVRGYEPRVRLLQKPNGGQASAFNFAVPQCQGDIVAFLDGDDWWAPEKLRLTMEAFAAAPEVGMVGNGITEVFDNGEQNSEVLTQIPRFRIDSVQGARVFRRRKSQMGTSRMVLRMEILRQILPVPETIFIEADEYIFTLAAALSEIMILGEALTFYRIHSGNLFQISGFQVHSIDRKRKSLESLEQALSEKLGRLGLPKKVVRAVVDPIWAEAGILRLQTQGGLPLDTVRVEWKFYRIVHEDASWAHATFKFLSLLPALLCSPKLYYGVRRKLAGSQFYVGFRRFFFPIPRPEHVTRSRRANP